MEKIEIVSGWDIVRLMLLSWATKRVWVETEFRTPSEQELLTPHHPRLRVCLRLCGSLIYSLKILNPALLCSES